MFLLENYLSVVKLHGLNTNKNAVFGGSASFKGDGIYNVKVTYGAKGDGSTDDTAAVQAAIDAANTAGGGIVFIPAGTFILNPGTGLSVKNNVYLLGTGPASIFKVANSKNTTGNLVRIESRSNVYISNLQLDGNKANQSSGTNYGLYFGSSSNCIAENIITKNFTGVGNHVYNGTGIHTLNCTSTGNTYHGFEAEQCVNSIWQGNRGYANTLHGLFISPGEIGGTGNTGCTFTGNSFDTNSQYGIGAGIDAGGLSGFLSTDNVISGNIIRANSQYGVQLYKVNGFVLTGNIIANNGFFGIYIYQGNSHMIVANKLHNNSASANNAYDEILLEGYNDDNTKPAKDNIISNNEILIDGSNKARYAISEATSGDGPNLIMNNRIPAAGATGTINRQNTSTALMTTASNGALVQTTPTTAPTVPNNGAVAFYLDESGNNLKVAVKYSSGTTKTGTVALA